MRRARSIADFVDRPLGRFSVGATDLVWCHSTSLVGSVHWGRYGSEDAAQLTERLAFRLPRTLGRFDVLVNARAVEGFEWAAWEVVMRYTRERVDTWNRCIRRHAIVVPDGIVGALLAGMFSVLRSSYDVRFFTSPGEAVAWLRRSELPAILDEVGGVLTSARTLPPAVRALHGYLSRTIRHATIESAARTLGRSKRSLQRALRDHGTTFSGELARARMQVARALLDQTDESIEVIARRAGCGSAATLRALFAREAGETPLRYRLRKRMGASVESQTAGRN